MRKTVTCPYCGETNEIFVDESGGSRQRYVEDCQVCCQPWNVYVEIDDDIVVSVSTADD